MHVTKSGGKAEQLPLVTVPLGDEPKSGRIPRWLQVHKVPIWWFEILLVVAFNFAYEHVRNLVKLQPLEAMNHGLAVLRFSQWTHLDLEQGFNGILFHNQWLATIADYDYSFLHLPLTASVLIWVFWKHRDRYLRIRNVLMITTLVGLIGFWLYPVAPPRLLPGNDFVDTVVLFHTPFALADPKMASATNQFAAMPSLHCAWALWCGLTLFLVARNRYLRAFGIFYPLWTVFVVMGTGNHYLLDCLAGYACVGIAVLIVSRFGKRNPWALPEPAPATPLPAEKSLGSAEASVARVEESVSDGSGSAQTTL